MTSTFCSLEGRTALVTGASRGIGRAIATELAAAGASVVLSYRTGAEEAETLAGEIGGRAVHADVSDPDSAQALVEEAGDLDILVNNAGVTRDGLLVRMSDDDWNTVIDTNLASCFYTCRAAARGMMKKRAGTVVNISSIVGIHGNWGQTNYAASKAGIIGFTKSLRARARQPERSRQRRRSRVREDAADRRPSRGCDRGDARRTRRSAVSATRRTSPAPFGSCARTKPRSSRARCCSSTAGWGCSR